jgi:hypothetical protein
MHEPAATYDDVAADHLDAIAAAHHKASDAYYDLGAAYNAAGDVHTAAAYNRRASDHAADGNVYAERAASARRRA